MIFFEKKIDQHEFFTRHNKQLYSESNVIMGNTAQFVAECFKGLKIPFLLDL